MRCKLLLYALFGLIISAFGWLNLMWRGPFQESVEQNALAFHGRHTELRRGWPMPFALKYPEGYVSPREWLPWEVDPVYSRWDTVGAVADATLGLVLLYGVWGILLSVGREHRTAVLVAF